MTSPADLVDRVAFCVVKANCPGPSFLTSTRDNQDMWTCRKCSGWAVTVKGEQPTKDKRKPGQ